MSDKGDEEILGPGEEEKSMSSMSHEETEVVDNEELIDDAEVASEHLDEMSEKIDEDIAIDEEALEGIEEGVTDEDTTVKTAEPTDEESSSPDDKKPDEEEQDDQFILTSDERKSIGSELKLDEMPRDDDVTAEELELNEPLDEWVAELVPSMRELIAPQLYPTEEPPDVQQDVQLDQPEPEPCRVPEVLLSESPMMARFQATLRAHLIRQKEKLQNDIFDMELVCNQKNKQIKDLGIMINKEQEHLNKQKDLVEKYKSGVAEVAKKRLQFDNANTKKAKEFKETETFFKDTEKEDTNLFQQYEEMNELAFRLGEMEKTQNEELKFAKNLSEKQRSDRILMAQEKQKQDLYIWKLTLDLERLTLQTQAFIEQTELKKKEISELAALVTDIEADTEALRKENSLIICATQQIVQEIKKRDKGFQDAEKKVGKAMSELTLVVTRIRSYNKSLRHERDKKMKLQSSKNKLDILMQRNQNLHQTLVLRHEEALEKLAQIQSVIDSIESEQSSKASEFSELTNKHKSVITEMDELTLRKLDLKNRYMSIMSDMKIQSSVTRKLQKSMEELSHENQDISLRKLEVDCKIGELMTDIEHSKVKRVQLEVKIDNLKNTIKDKETILQSLEVHKRKIHQQIQTYKSKMIGSQKRLDYLIKFNDDSQGQNQLSRRFSNLEKEVDALDTKINEVKQGWMDTQNNLIENTYKLSELESTTNTIRKHLFLTKYKREKLENKMTELETEKKKADKEFALLYNKLSSMTLENYRHEQVKEKLADMSKETEAKFISVLKDAEDTAVSLQEELCNLEESNRDMTEEISRLQREFLAWEKKWKMAVEARERVEKERAATGEIGAMKLEIHRMEVRYSQLKRVQEKLSQDLELCISRRDNIMDLALAKEKRASSTKASYTREQFNKKLDSIKLKIKQLQNAMKNCDKEVEELEVRREELMNDYLTKQKHLSEVKLGVEKLETEIQEGQLHKYKSLELVVRRQRRLRLLDEVKHNRYRLFCRNETNLPHEQEKQDNMGCDLVEVVEALLGDFPKLRLQLIQIHNTLTSPLD